MDSLGNTRVYELPETDAQPVTPESGEKKRRPGRPKGLGKVPGSGRKPGSKNRLTKDVKEAILVDGKPLETLFSMARGRRMKAADPDDPRKPTWVYPSLSDRERAARTLLAKCVPDMRAQELSVKSDPAHAFLAVLRDLNATPEGVPPARGAALDTQGSHEHDSDPESQAPTPINASGTHEKSPAKISKE